MLVGEKINRLTLMEITGVKEIGNSKKRLSCGIFICGCGEIKELTIFSVTSGKTKSCGCYSREIATTHGFSGHPLYRQYWCMKARCYQESSKYYNNYGGRGIKVCDEWLASFVNFYNWSINNGWKEGLQIDRVDNDGNYEPDNCQWITNKENNAIGKKGIQNNNTSGFVGVSYYKKKWHTELTVNGVRVYRDKFDNLNEAVEARISKEIEIFGQQRTNFHYLKK